MNDNTPNPADAMALAGMHGGDASVIVGTALAASEPTTLNPTGPPLTFVVPEGAQLQTIDPEGYAAQPSRRRGTVEVATVDSLIAYTTAHGELGTTLWVH